MNRHTEFYKAIKDIIPTLPFTLVDYCCGDASLGALFDSHPSIQRMFFVDVRKTRGLEANLSRLTKPFEFSIEGIASHNPDADALVVGVHACGTLTDRLIEKAISTRNPFAVMPCCYRNGMNSLRPSSNHRLPVSYSHKDYRDSLRLEYAKERGYYSEMRLIDRKVTPMNHILVGIPI